jgi:hypothetical protein
LGAVVCGVDPAAPAFAVLLLLAAALGVQLVALCTGSVPCTNMFGQNHRLNSADNSMLQSPIYLSVWYVSGL